MYSNDRRPWSLPTHTSIGLMRNPVFKEPDKGPSDTSILIKLHGWIEKEMEVDRLTTASELSKCLSEENLQFIHNGRILPNYLSFGYLRIQNLDSLFVRSIGQSFEDTDESSNSLCNVKCNRPSVGNTLGHRLSVKSMDSSEKLRYRFYQKWAQKFEDPESVFEKIRIYSDNTLSAEAARMEDLRRSQIERNLLSYRKVCNRYSSHSDLTVYKNEKDEMNKINSPTVLPKKTMLPSTDLLPVMQYDSSLANLNHGSTVS